MREDFVRNVVIFAPRATDIEFELLGAQDGIPARYADSIVSILDAELGLSASIELYYVGPAVYSPRRGPSSWSLRSWRWFSFGHAALRYRLGDVERVFNVAGDSDVNPSRTLFSYMSPYDYLYSVTSSAFQKSEQMGVYHRFIIGVRLLHISPATVARLHQCFEDLIPRSGKSAFFSILTRQDGHITRANCSHFVSLGLVAAGLLEKTSPFPKSVALALLRHPHQIVSYERIRHSRRNDLYRDWDVDVNGSVEPLRVASSFALWELDSLASAVVLVPDDTVTLKVVTMPREITAAIPFSHWFGDAGAVQFLFVLDVAFLVAFGVVLTQSAWTLWGF
jgi:hypothetical protein